jgi:hemerythrin-like domain-containing protein
LHINNLLLKFITPAFEELVLFTAALVTQTGSRLCRNIKHIPNIKKHLFMYNPVSILRQEHKLLMDAIEKTRQIQQIQDATTYQAAVHDMIVFFQNFTGMCHFPKEDKILFPLVQGRTHKLDAAFIDDICSHHQDLEQFISEILDAYTMHDYRTVRLALNKYLNELEDEIETEEREILSIADALLSVKESEIACKDFERHDARLGAIGTIKGRYRNISDFTV